MQQAWIVSEMDDFLYAIWKFIQERESEFYQTHKEENPVSHIQEKATQLLLIPESDYGSFYLNKAISPVKDANYK